MEESHSGDLSPTLRRQPPVVPADSRPEPGATFYAVLGRAADLDRPHLLALLRNDQRQRWQQGQRLLVETYLEQEPRLRQDDEAVLDLLYNEVLLREEQGDAPRAEEYARRFPGSPTSSSGNSPCTGCWTGARC